MTPEEAQAQIDAIRADKTHPAHSLDAAEAEAGAQELLDLTRVALGPRGSTLVENTVSVRTPTPAPASNLPPEEQRVYLGLVQTELVNAAPELSTRLGVAIDPKTLRAFAAALQPRPDGWPLGVEDVLRQHPPDTRAELAYLHRLGWDAVRRSGVFPTSADVEAERTGAHYAPGFFEYVVRVGARVRDQRKERP